VIPRPTSFYTVNAKWRVVLFHFTKHYRKWYNFFIPTGQAQPSRGRKGRETPPGTTFENELSVIVIFNNTFFFKNGILP
jgi:hypothetical protein